MSQAHSSPLTPVPRSLNAGVLTKLDLMDPGTDARDVLAGRVVPLRRGFVPVVCRSQKDIADGLPMDRAIAREKAFFERHPAYRAYAGRCGTGYLARLLSHMLMAAVKAWLPQVRADVSLMAQTAEQSLRELGDPVDTAGGGGSDAGHLLLKLLSRFAANFCDMVDGRVHADESDDLLTEQMFGGARIQVRVQEGLHLGVICWIRQRAALFLVHRRSSARASSARLPSGLQRSSAMTRASSRTRRSSWRSETHPGRARRSSFRSRCERGCGRGALS
jgi:hypothetical protein